MLNHLNTSEMISNRVVVLGCQGFVGSHILNQLKKDGIKTCGISKNELNLLENNAAEKLLNQFKSNDTLIIVSALVPCKNIQLLIDNLRMMQVICTAIEKLSFSHIIYMSSDAVYPDELDLVTEHSVSSPSSMHGMMHSCRELMLKQTVKKTPFAILRPALLYGQHDPHNGYGPNRFKRLAEKNEDIILFGEGEEKRDHVFIKDVGKIVSLVVKYRSEGFLNIATGESLAFCEIANQIIKLMKSKSKVLSTPRNNPITHRHYDNSACYKAFPLFKYTSFQEGLKEMVETESEELFC